MPQDKKEPAPKRHWEIQYNPGPKGGSPPKDAFNPRVASDRPCTHNKVNKTDH